MSWVARQTDQLWNEPTDVAAKQIAGALGLSGTRHIGLIDPLFSHRDNLIGFFSRNCCPIDCGAFDITGQVQTLRNKEVAEMMDSSRVNRVRTQKEFTTVLQIASASVSTLSPVDEGADPGATRTVFGMWFAPYGSVKSLALRICPAYFCVVGPEARNGCYVCEL